MNDDQVALHHFGGIVALFPLPNVVLFPQVMQPLHIFEPRYRRMTADALAGDRLIALVLLKPGWEENYEGQPDLHRIACLGRIVAEQELEDGRYNILLHGLSRIRIVRELNSDKLYRSAQVDLLKECGLPAPADALDLRRQLDQQVQRWFPPEGVVREQLERLFDSDLPLNNLADIFSFALPLSMPVKQHLLEETHVERRVRHLVRHLREARLPSPPTYPERHFPPDFSAN
ncbi:MAG: LON peptidase substrate-binding domain-containing protein [Gemmataceae bacterium]